MAAAAKAKEIEEGNGVSAARANANSNRSEANQEDVKIETQEAAHNVPPKDAGDSFDEADGAGGFTERNPGTARALLATKGTEGGFDVQSPK